MITTVSEMISVASRRHVGTASLMSTLVASTATSASASTRLGTESTTLNVVLTNES